MGTDLNEALIALIQMYSIKLKTLEDEMMLLHLQYEEEMCNLKSNEALIELLEVMLDAKKTGPAEIPINPLTDNKSDVKIKTQTSRHSITRKYEWNDDRITLLLDSIEKHFNEISFAEDGGKSVWEKIRAEVEPDNKNLKWFTCRQKWAHLEADYMNYIKDLKVYSARNHPELTVFLPTHHEKIGKILGIGWGGIYLI